MNIIWAAGLFEGEGCIVSNRPNKRRYELRLRMSDKDVVSQFAEVVGFGTISFEPSNNSNHKDLWCWCLTGKLKVRSLLIKLLPYLGMRRAHAALDKLDDIELS